MRKRTIHGNLGLKEKKKIYRVEGEKIQRGGFF